MVGAARCCALMSKARTVCARAVSGPVTVAHDLRKLDFDPFSTTQQFEGVVEEISKSMV